MEWHVDELLFDAPQLELVFTVVNDSDSVTQWRGAGGEIREEWTEPNSLLVGSLSSCVRAMGDRSCPVVCKICQNWV